ncbi:MAG: DnaA regulatory inactivator Hda [Legionellales bacterium]|nr:DnaA regulatory inactivator Hda [Legionellales bacterium]
MQQLTLPVQLDDDATFANFYVSDHNQQAVSAVKNSMHSIVSMIYLWGSENCGRTHLLQAAAHQAQLNATSVFYLSLRDFSCYHPDILQGIEHYSLICLDDVGYIASNKIWEEALFHCYNRIFDAKNTLLMSAATTPQDCGFYLPDLASRLAFAAIFHLHPLNDNEKIQAFILRGKQRGLEISTEVAEFIIKRWPRKTSDLFHALEKIDKASLILQRKVTIPFVKQVLEI